ncbi:MAG: ImmA/IrrE family metallo-endopeptidase [Flavobacteriaceae bacterium]|jgi:Zn-dependent peptidase ImmA (M78 family)|nr:ImmA/IrrE family metallo-endopeptidase [Flavobacteriaceae bacterium]
MSKGKRAAQRLMLECGIDDPTEFPLDLIVHGRGATLVEKPLKNSEGRIVFGKSKVIITVNSDIIYLGKKRFVIAHELGHFEMHRNLVPLHHDTDATLEYFKNGHQETEANEFASELLMPEKMFKKECENKKFNPDLLRYLADRFQTSITSVVYKYFELGDYPICLFYSYNNKVQYWKRPEGYPHFINDRTKLAPPEDSVAAEFFDEQKIYKKERSKQQIWKSTWFEMKHWENDNDYNFFEYCIVTPSYNTVLSIVWEEA